MKKKNSVITLDSSVYINYTQVLRFHVPLDLNVIKWEYCSKHF